MHLSIMFFLFTIMTIVESNKLDAKKSNCFQIFLEKIIGEAIVDKSEQGKQCKFRTYLFG